MRQARTTFTAAATAALLLALTACGSSSGDGDSSGQGDSKAASGTPTASAATSADLDGAYIAATQTIPFTTHRPTTAELLAYPPQWCDGLDAGHSVEWLLSTDGGLYPVGQDWGTVKEDAYQLLLAGAKVYCPEHTAAVTEELRASGAY